MDEADPSMQPCGSRGVHRVYAIGFDGRELTLEREAPGFARRGSAKLGGEVALPAGDVPEPFVDAEDIADVAAAALTEEGHAGQLYELTGPRLLTFGEAVGEIARAAGREIRYVSVSVEEYAAMLAEHEVPAEYVELLTYVFGEVLDGRNAHLTDGVRRALGREPKDFSDYARETAAAGVWDGKR
jgi:uncharacterized protein YbjT (DUF2867 family)